MTDSSFIVNLYDLSSPIPSRKRDPAQFTSVDEAIAYAKSLLPQGPNEQVRIFCSAPLEDMRKIEAAGFAVAT